MRRHLGSTIAIILGILQILAGVSYIGKGEDSKGFLQSGLLTIIGALAYRSAKKRKLNEVSPSILRRVLEGVAISIIILHFVVIKKNYLIDDPLVYFVIPVWALVAYLIISLQKAKPLGGEIN